MIGKLINRKNRSHGIFRMDQVRLPASPKRMEKIMQGCDFQVVLMAANSGDLRHAFMVFSMERQDETVTPIE